MAATKVSVETTADVRAWRELLARHADITCALDRALQTHHALGMSEYEVLERLAELPDHSAKIATVAKSVHLSQSALSRVIARLETDGLVTRDVCTQDRRAVIVCLTAEGLRRQAEAQPTQREVLADRLHAPLIKSCEPID
ncbi:MarR family transcriptional regulator [Kribbella sandramycini]|uniref:MarR family transcriptional regulator n=1 Tax=Kribbella sandramycini TaxID=60450 RepID=A0A7Y4L4H6_9ACTN|nr:MarR family transcriptional regulator [Kribbella sandramycini]MBB6571494.1 DNA-binding MarR family transcriptional regulator [Kribbella sandramycini]NOL44143.1 MarR family transcriptional regulator [Kribbella sandramycini]